MSIRYDFRKTFTECLIGRYYSEGVLAESPVMPNLDSYFAFMEKCIDEKTPCNRCGRIPSEDHPTMPKHKKTYLLGGGDDWDNLEPLCSKCHNLAVLEGDIAKVNYLQKSVKARGLATPPLGILGAVQARVALGEIRKAQIQAKGKG